MMVKNLLMCLAILCLGHAAAADNLYSGEQRLNVNGYPAIMKFIPGDPKKPLIVFSPGAHHNARISYGGHAGANEDDFIASWLTKLGYNFLAVSYPIDTKSKFIDAPVSPDFNAQAWGKQVAAAAKAATLTNGLSGHVVLLNWSMGGKVLQPAYKAVIAQGLSVDGAISMMATPGIIGLSSRRELNKAPSRYADRSDAYGRWLNQIKVNRADNEGREAIPEDVYRSDYVGDIPAGLQGFGEVMRNGKFEFDEFAQSTDYGGFEFADYPLVAILRDDSALDAEHVLIDRQWWGIYNAETLFNRLTKAGVDFGKISPSDWQRVRKLSDRINDELVISMGGNHFSFVGRSGAANAAKKVDLAIQKLDELNKELLSIK